MKDINKKFHQNMKWTPADLKSEKRSNIC